MTRPFRICRGGRAGIAHAGVALLAVVAAFAASTGSPSGRNDGGFGVWRFEVELGLARAPTAGQSLGRCTAELDERNGILSLSCAHGLEGDSEVVLVPRGEAVTAEAVLRLGWASSPFELRVPLAPELVTMVIEDRLDVLIEGPPWWPGVVIGALDEPVFVSDFEAAGICEWSNFGPACVDANVCTDDICEPATGACTHDFNTVACPLPNATGACAGGSCSLTSCAPGFSNCDSSEANGCEVGHGAAPNSCGSASWVAAYAGDTECGTFCPTSGGWALFATRTARNSIWLQAQVVEASTLCFAAIEHRLVLDVPSGVDYNLYVYSACGSLIGSSTQGTGNDEEVFIYLEDVPAVDDTSYYWVEVRFVGGSSCLNWSLHFYGHDC